MRKIPKEYENPFDNLLIILSDKLSPLFKAIGLSPNDITSLSLVTGLGSAFSIYKRQYSLAATLYVISYFFDCMAGHYARKYNMTTKFGDIYDHVKDILVVIAMVVAFLLRTVPSLAESIVVLSLIAISTVLLTIHIGCQEVLYEENDEKDNEDDNKDDKNGVLSMTKSMWSVDNAHKYIKYTRFFGTGSFTLLIAAILTYFQIKWLVKKYC